MTTAMVVIDGVRYRREDVPDVVVVPEVDVEVVEVKAKTPANKAKAPAATKEA